MPVVKLNIDQKPNVVVNDPGGSMASNNYPGVIKVIASQPAAIIAQVKGLFPSASGNDNSMFKAVAGQNLSSGRVVYIQAGKAYYFNPDDVSLYGKSFGITTQAALQDGNVSVQMFGVMYWPDNNLSAGSVYYAGSQGQFTTDPNSLHVLQRIGHAIAQDKFKIQFDLNCVTT
jgi:hypothetical protein